MTEFTIEAMSCGHCVSTITRTVQQLDPEAKVQVDLAHKKVEVESTRDRNTLAAALAEAGFPPA